MKLTRKLLKTVWKLARAANGRRRIGSKAFFGWALRKVLKETKELAIRAMAEVSYFNFQADGKTINLSRGNNPEYFFGHVVLSGNHIVLHMDIMSATFYRYLLKQIPEMYIEEAK